MHVVARKINKALTCGLKTESNKLKLNKQMSKIISLLTSLVADSILSSPAITGSESDVQELSELVKGSGIGLTINTNSFAKTCEKLETTITKETLVQ